VEREIKVVALRKTLKEGEETSAADYSSDGLIKELENEGSVK
jgi:hypothetical protein